MSLQIQQYVRQINRTVILTLSPSFVSEHPHVRPDNVLVHNFTTRGIVFSIIHNGEMTVFCCAVQISMPQEYGKTEIEITSSETQMKYFTENLSRRLPSLIYRLNEQVMFDDEVQADRLREIWNNLEVVLLTSKLFMVMFDSTIYFFRIDFEDEVFCFKLPLLKLNQTTYKDSMNPRIRDFSRRFDSFRFFKDLQVYDDHVDFDVFSDVFGNSCVRASVRIHFDDDNDTLVSRVICSRKQISRGVDSSYFSSTSEPDFEETPFSDKTLKIREEGSEEEYSDEEESDEEDPDDGSGNESDNNSEESEDDY